MATTKLYANKDGEKAQVAFIRLGTANGSDKVVRIQRGMQVLYDDWPVCTISANAEHTTGIVPATLRYGQPWAAVLITDSGYGIDTVEILMNGIDITENVYEDGVISIPRVTGNVAITVETSSVTDTNMFTKRTTGNGISILNDKALLKGIRGNTLMFYQKLINPDFSDGQTSWVGRSGYNFTITVEDGILRIKGPSNCQPYLVQEGVLTEAHDYLLIARVRIVEGTAGKRLYLRNANSSWQVLTDTQLNTWYTVSTVRTFTSAPTSGNRWFGIMYDEYGATMEVDWAQCIDLTRLRGVTSGIVGSYDAFHKLFPRNVYDYGQVVINNSMTNYISKRYDAVGVTPVNSTNVEWTDAPVSGAAPTVTPVDGIFTITVKSNNRAIIRSRNSVGASGKVYYWACYVKAPTGNFHFGNNGASISSVTLKHDGWERVSRINNGAVTRCEFQVRDATIGDTIQFKNLIYVSLTDMFGAGNEPTIAECNVIFDSIQNWQTANAFNNWNLLDRIGKSTNIWDEQAEKGYIDASGNLVNGNYLRSVNYIPVTPNYRIYWNYTSGGTYDLQIARYDAEKTFIERVGAVGSYLIPSDTYYIKFYLHTNYGTTYRNNVILSTSPAPVYEPLNKVSALDVTNATGKLNGEGESVVIFPDGMKSTVCLPSVTPSYISKSDSKASYFDLDYIPTGTDVKLVAKIRVNSFRDSSSERRVLSAYTDNSHNIFSIYRYSTSNSYFYVRWGAQGATQVPFTISTDLNIVVESGSITINGTSTTISTYRVENDNIQSFKVFEGCNGWIYSLQLYKGEDLVIDCIPYRDGNVVGLYDRARDRIFTLTQASGEGTISAIEPAYEELPDPTYDEIKQDNGVWKAYKRISDIRVTNTANTGRGEYVPFAEEKVYILDDQTIPTEITVVDQGTEEILPVNGTTPTTAPTTMEIQYGSIPQNNLLGGGLLGGMLGGSNNGGGSDDEEQEDDEPDYEEPVNEEESEEPVEEDDTN